MVSAAQVESNCIPTYQGRSALLCHVRGFVRYGTALISSCYDFRRTETYDRMFCKDSYYPVMQHLTKLFGNIGAGTLNMAITARFSHREIQSIGVP